MKLSSLGVEFGAHQARTPRTRDDMMWRLPIGVSSQEVATRGSGSLVTSAIEFAMLSTSLFRSAATQWPRSGLLRPPLRKYGDQTQTIDDKLGL